MDRRRINFATVLRALLLVAAALLLCACTAGDKPGAVDVPPGAVVENDPVVSAPAAEDPSYTRTPPPVKMPALGDAQEHRESNGQAAMIDTSHLSEGYVGASATADVRIIFRVVKDGVESKYDLDGDGTPSFFPLNMGDGSYTLTVFMYLYESDNGPMYDPFLSTQVSATLANEQGPYSIPTRLVRYDETSDCVQESYDVSTHSKTNLEVTQQVVAWIADNIVYDTAEAEEIGGKAVQYEPYPDEVYQTKKGICYDYSSLAAAMLRANGIPTKLVKGQVATADGQIIYHAWNMVWLEEDGWIVLDLPATRDEWSRVDTTFLASGGSGYSQFIGDGKNYNPMSEH